VKRKVSLKTEEKFLAWWNEAFFSTAHSFYQSYKQLYVAGANLDYIFFLHIFLSAIDVFSEEIRQFSKEAKKKKRRKNQPDNPELVEIWTRYVKAYIRGRVEGAQKYNPTDPLLNPQHPLYDVRWKQITKRGGRDGQTE